MRYLLIADTYPPLRSSGANQLRDLSVEFINQGHELTVFISSPNQKDSCYIEKVDGVKIIRVKTPKTKDINYFYRTFSEIFMPFFMIYNGRKSSAIKSSWDGIIWYSPSIFLGPVIKYLKLKNNCKTYLIIRDIFPEWSADMGLMKRNRLPYFIFNAFAQYQYSLANVIGIQTIGNKKYFAKYLSKKNTKLEVLQNWLSVVPKKKSSISIKETRLFGRKIIIYTGNMGVAQDMNLIMSLVHEMKDRSDVGFLMVGRGSELPNLKFFAKEKNLTNIIFHDEIDPNEIPSLYNQCSIGLVSLSQKHESHNIPGKFISYMRSGLPVLAFVNKGNDIVKLIESSNVGHSYTDNKLNNLSSLVDLLINDIDLDKDFINRCKKLYLDNFSSDIAVKKIIKALN